MISALKRFSRKKEDAAKSAEMPPGISSMGQSLQRKFGRGVQYNMKMVIKGDRNTGKSALFARFQGKSFVENYIQTNEIQVCSINWSYRVSDDVVKVEIWDVVDKGKKKSHSDGLKLANTLSATDDQISDVLDAEFLDIYKGTHGCIMMLDITKQWTFKYIERELPKVPAQIPVLVLANFLDMGEHRVIQLDEIIELIKSVDRGKNAALIEYGECCMKNSFGLKFIHKFFNVPFLTLQRETLEKQLQTNKEDTKATVEELSFHRKSEEQDYEKYLLYLEKRANEKKQKSTPVSVKENGAQPSATLSTSIKKNTTPTSSKKTQVSSQSVDDFVVDETIDSEFLGKDDNEVRVNQHKSDESDDSDSENDGNPMVSGFQDISSDEEDNMQVEQETSAVTQINTQEDVQIDITSSESENEDEAGVVQTRDVKDGAEKKTNNPAKTETLNISKLTKDVDLDNEDSFLMDAWLDSPNTNPPAQKKGLKKSGSGGSKTKDISKENESDNSDENQSNPQVSFKQVVADNEENSSEELNEEKKKKQSEKKTKNGDEAKEKRRSKHKHKKKSRSKESGEENIESSEKVKSKRKQRHKHSKSREKKENVDYESF